MKGIEELVEDLPFQSYFGISFLRCERNVDFFLPLTDEVTKSSVTEFHLDEEDFDRFLSRFIFVNFILSRGYWLSISDQSQIDLCLYFMQLILIMMFPLKKILLFKFVSAAPFGSLWATAYCPNAVMVKLFHKFLSRVGFIVFIV